MDNIQLLCALCARDLDCMRAINAAAAFRLAAVPHEFHNGEQAAMRLDKYLQEKSKVVCCNTLTAD